MCFDRSRQRNNESTRGGFSHSGCVQKKKSWLKIRIFIHGVTPTNSPQIGISTNEIWIWKSSTRQQLHTNTRKCFSQACSHKIWPSLWPFCGKSGEKNTGILTTTFRWTMKLSALYEKITYDMWVGCQGLEHDGMQQLTFWFGCRSHYNSSLKWESLFLVEKRLSYAIVVG